MGHNDELFGVLLSKEVDISIYGTGKEVSVSRCMEEKSGDTLTGTDRVWLDCS
jgi:hypothetical protein